MFEQMFPSFEAAAHHVRQFVAAEECVVIPAEGGWLVRLAEFTGKVSGRSEAHGHIHATMREAAQSSLVEGELVTLTNSVMIGRASVAYALRWDMRGWRRVARVVGRYVARYCGSGVCCCFHCLVRADCGVGFDWLTLVSHCDRFISVGSYGYPRMGN